MQNAKWFFGFWLVGPALRFLILSFILYPSSFIFHLSSFIFHPSREHLAL